MNGNARKSAAAAGERVMERFAASKEAVTEAIEDGTKTVRQLAKRTQDGLEDFLDDAKHSIKRFPLRSVAVAFGVGAVFGLLIARAGRR